MKKSLCLLSVLFMSLTVSCSDSSDPVPIESVRIGDQVLMKRNLDVAYYRNGEPIPEVTDREQWANLTTGAWCYYKNDPANGAVYGKLYNWYAVADPRGLCPFGWHVPTDDEWTILEDSLGGREVAGGALKEAGYAHWYEPNFGATNSSGFTALPGGYRFGGEELDFDGMFWSGEFWTCTEINENSVWTRYLDYGQIRVVRSIAGNRKHIGFSVRCVKD